LAGPLHGGKRLVIAARGEQAGGAQEREKGVVEVQALAGRGGGIKAGECVGAWTGGGESARQGLVRRSADSLRAGR
jgi:hypothetical protein